MSNLKKGIMPPSPDWRCVKCGNTGYLNPVEDIPEKCPLCGGKVIPLTLRKRY